jgi:hypothetical protein
LFVCLFQIAFARKGESLELSRNRDPEKLAPIRRTVDISVDEKVRDQNAVDRPLQHRSKTFPKATTFGRPFASSSSRTSSPEAVRTRRQECCRCSVPCSKVNVYLFVCLSACLFVCLFVFTIDAVSL